jgi:hypothetical protein
MTLSFSNSLSRGMILAATGWLLVACSGADVAPTGPSVTSAALQPESAQQAIASIGALTTVRTLGRMIPLSQPATASARIGPEGGTIALPAVGLRLVVPRGAVDSVTTFKVTALAGNAIAYEFAPHGITFKVPLQLQQSLGRSTWLPGLPLRGGYFKSAGQVNTKLRQAQVDELLPATQSGAEAVLQLKHFSGYLIAMG